uniref:hypothetical protein n=1 Tax=Neorhizobium sp. EC2-8 TaxID=3129230 RepID=UPI0031019651
MGNDRRGNAQKLLIVERKLSHNRGHHHTQISALSMLLPDHDMNFVAGESYDGFLGAAAGKLTTKSIKLAKLRSRLQFGNIFERLGAVLGTIKARHALKLPFSAFGVPLAELCQSLQLGPADLVIVPTGDLDTLESAVEATAMLIGKPRICLRFLNSELGDRNEKIRSKRLSAVLAKLPPNVFLFTETEELASYFRKDFKMPVESGFYLPCSMPIAMHPKAEIVRGGRFRIGVFGEPRPEKGSTRLAGIVAALAELAETGSGRPVDFVIQGSIADFQEGVFMALCKNFGRVKGASLFLRSIIGFRLRNSNSYFIRWTRSCCPTKRPSIASKAPVWFKMPSLHISL